MKRRFGLLVGVDRYPRLTRAEQLLGATHDAEEMASLLEHRFRFESNRLSLLLNEAATRRGVLDAMARLEQSVESGDHVVMHWSGHGSRVYDKHGDEPDGLDETFAPYDVSRQDGDPPRDILDHELRGWLRRLGESGAQVTVFLDCCHSGHLYRRGGSRRIAPWLAAGRRVCLPEEAQGPGARRSAGAVGMARAVVLAACRDDEEAFERWLPDGRSHGAWTHALLRELARSSPGQRTMDVFVRARHRLFQEAPGQTPQIAGAIDRSLLGSETFGMRRFVRVGGLGKEGVELLGGAVLGLTKGSCWRVVPPNEQPAAEASVLGEVEVAWTRGSKSFARWLGHRPEIDETLHDVRAYLEAPAYGNRRLKVYLAGPRAVARDMEEVSGELKNSPVLRPSEREAIGSGVIVRWEGAGDEARIELLDAGGCPWEAAISTTSSHWRARLIERLERRARWRHGLSIVNDDPASEVQGKLGFRLLRRRSRSWQAVALGEPDIFAPGERFALEIEHEIPALLHVAVLDFGCTERVGQVHPWTGAEEVLEPGRVMAIGKEDDDPLRFVLPSDTWRPSDRPMVTSGFLKLFATRRAVDLSWLMTSSSWPDASRASSLEDLLSMGAGPVFRDDNDWGVEMISYRLES